MIIYTIILLIGIGTISPVILYHVVRGWQIVQLLKFKKRQREENKNMPIQNNDQKQCNIKELDVDDPMFA